MNHMLATPMNPIVQYLVDRAEDYYNIGRMHRAYHNLYHMQSVVNALFEITERPSDELILAAVWHDAVYFPGAVGDSNELSSSAALNMEFNTFAQRSGVQREIVNKAMTLIAFTTVNMHMSKGEHTGDLAILLDADLKSLSGPYDEFVQTQKRIVSEHNATWENGATKCAKFLSGFLTVRPQLYHTNYARKNWQQQAVDNIRRLIEEHQEET